MQEMKYDEMERRASLANELDLVKQLEAKARVHGVVKEMIAEDKALVLTAEEEEMLREFRRFKLRMRRDGLALTWQTRRPEGIEVVQDTAEIVHPRAGS